MPLDAQILLPDKKTRPDVFVSYSSFFVFLTLKGSYPPLPLTVEIVETPDPAVGPAAFRLPSMGILDLAKRTKIDDPTSMLPWRSYQVGSLASFTLQNGYPRVKFLIEMKTDDATLLAFKGSQMTLTVKDGATVVGTSTVSILNADPNNHYHWDKESTFVDGAWFKVIHVDAANQLATAFFFLYGVSNPASPSPTGESFAMTGRGGAIQLDPTARVPVPPPALTTAADVFPYDPVPRPAASDYVAEASFYGLDAKVGTTFATTDISLKGTATLKSGGTAKWNLSLTKIYTACATDWNPLAYFATFMPFFCVSNGEPYGKLSRHLVSFLGSKAYYMSHNMNCFVSGSIEWDGTTYNFSDTLGHKAYQDSNWGSDGFPHPYVWMQANHFFDANAATVLYDTALVAMYTPLMPVTLGSTQVTTVEVGGICLRHGGKTYEFDIVSPLMLPALSAQGMWIYYQSGQRTSAFDCSVLFVTASGNATLDMTQPGTIPAVIGSYPRITEVRPIKWTIHASNNAGDDITIVAECDQNSILFLAAPMGGVMKPSVTKETLLARFSVTLKPAGGGATISLVSDFGTAEYGD